jgi:hypothetical protein
VKIGDLVIVTRSPFEEGNIFRYKNGEIGLVIAEYGKSTSDLLVLFFNPKRELIIPIFYLDKLGE